MRINRAENARLAIVQKAFLGTNRLITARLFTSRLLVTCMLVVSSVMQACYSTSYDATGVSPAFTMSTSSTPLAIEPGNHTSTGIKDLRKAGFSAPITHVVTSGPVGLSFSFANTSNPDSVTLVITSVAATVPGVYTIAVQADAPGAARQEVRISIVVNSPVVTNTTPTISLLSIGAHSCALATTGAAYCWGGNDHGQLGNDDIAIAIPNPVAVAGGIVFQSLSVSQVEPVSCGLQVGGKAFCWGRNARGELGDNTFDQHLSPNPVAGGLNFRDIAVGNAHVCAVALNGDMYCWGTSPNGALGNASTEAQRTPLHTALGMKFDHVVAGSDFTCALTPDGAAYCWGLGFSAQLGDGRSLSSTTPVAVAGGLTFRDLVAGAATVCGLTPAGKAYCWGSNFFGTVGDGTSGQEGGLKRTVPVAVTGDLTFKSLSAGLVTMCGLTVNGSAYCWGYNEDGLIGDGTFSNRSSPTPVTGGFLFKTISAGSVRSCGVTTFNFVYCWGDNTNGGLGSGSVTAPGSPTPVAVLWQ